MQRRDFLKVTLTGAGALFVGVSCGSPAVREMRAAAEKDGTFRPAAFLTITPDDRVQVGMGKSEMGQGTFTTHAILVAEELAVPVDRIEVFPDVAGPAYEVFGFQITGGSTSTPDAWIPIRTAAAAARTMLVASAAQVWGCKIGECTVEDGVVMHAASGRKLRYGELLKQAAERDIPDDVALKPRAEYAVIGQPTPRTDLLPKVTGAPIFGIDVQIEGMVKAVVLRPPTFTGTPTRVDAAEAKGMAGVVDVFEIPSGVAVVAEKYWQARRAAAKVVVEWDPGRNAKLDSDALMSAAVAESANEGAAQREEGDVDDAFEAAAERGKVVEAVYAGPYLAHAPLEPMNATAHVEKDRVRVWAGTQFQSAVRSTAARMGGVDLEQVEVYTTYLGGGFGRRGVLDFVSMALEVSKRTGRPAQVIWSREEDTRAGFYRPLMLARMKGAIDSNGTATAISGHALSQSLFNLETIVPSFVPGWLPAKAIARAAGHIETSDSLPNVLATEGLATLTYAIPNVRVAFTPIRVTVPVTFWRSVGHSVNAFAVEGFMNELAHAAGADAFEFRRGLLGGDPRKLKVLEAAAELGGWGAPLDEGWGRGIAAHQSFGTYCAQVVEAGVFDGEIRVRRISSAMDCGQIINPDQVKAQIESAAIFGLSAALWGRIDIREGRVQQGNYDDYRVLRLHETPEFRHTLIDSAESPTGSGEPGLPPVAPALAGALFAVTGKWLRRMPLTDALKEAT